MYERAKIGTDCEDIIMIKLLHRLKEKKRKKNVSPHNNKYYETKF